MYNEILKTIEANADQITGKILKEIRTRPEAAYYKSVSNEVVTIRISHVIRDVYKRLENWLGKNEPKNLLFAYYSDLGAMRCRQCVPLDAVTALFLILRNEIIDIIKAQTSSDIEPSLGLTEKINYYTNLLFVGIIQSIITGYRNELDAVIDMRLTSTNWQIHILMKQYMRRLNDTNALTVQVFT